MPLMVNGMNVGILPQSKLYDLMNLENDKVLVLIQLQGGNDGLNTVIPLEFYDRLSGFRPNIILPENRLLKLDDETAFHPNWGGMKNLFDDGKLGVVHSVGYPNQNRSHFRSTDIWTSATAADEYDSRGWLGRYLDTKHPNFPVDYPNSETPDPIAITMSSLVSETCQGVAANFSMALNDPFGLGQLDQGQGSTPPNTPYGVELQFIRDAIAQTNAYSDNILDAANSGNNMVNYADNNRLAQQLKNVALLISGGLQTKVFVCNLGGFDTHANQVQNGDSLAGIHTQLLSYVSDAIETFQTDLSRLGLEERVIGMTFSEFGRQISSNESLGTDHGTAAPLFVFGSCVNPGFLGTNPEIPQSVQPQEGVAMQVDFRDVYGSVLMDWFEVPESSVKDILYEDFEHLPVLRDCTISTKVEESVVNMDFETYPNPFVQNVKVAFEIPAMHARLSVFDARGSEVLVAFDKNLPSGKHEFNLDTSRLAAGNYYIRLKSKLGHQTKMAVKVN